MEVDEKRMASGIIMVCKSLVAKKQKQRKQEQKKGKQIERQLLYPSATISYQVLGY